MPEAKCPNCGNTVEFHEDDFNCSLCGYYVFEASSKIEEQEPPPSISFEEDGNPEITL